MMEQRELILTIDAVKRGEEGAEAALFRLYHSELYEYILEKVKSATIAQRATQDAFIEIFDTIESLADEDDFVCWSRQIADRKCISVIELQLNQLSEISSGNNTGTMDKRRSIKSFFGKVAVGIVIAVLSACARKVFIEFKNTQHPVSGNETQTSSEEGTFEESLPETEETEQTEEASSAENVSETETEQTKPDSSEPQESRSDTIEERTSEGETTEPYVPGTEAAEPEQAEPIWVGAFQLIKRGTYYEVIGYMWEDRVWEREIPSEYEGLPVTTIGDCVFEGKYVGRMHIPKSITHISRIAFRRCYGSQEIQVDEENPFYHSIDRDCLIETATGTVIMGRTVPQEANIKHIGEYAYSNYDLSAELVIPEGVISIGKHAFEYAKHVKCVWLPSTLTSIDSAVFTGARKLTEFYYAGTMEQWGAITKAKDWDHNTVGYVIHCTDGDLWK